MSDARDLLIHTVLRTAVAQAALQAGAVGISQGSLDTLTDVVLRYIEEIGYSAGRKAELACRTQVNAHDLMDSLGGLGVQLRQLASFRARVQNDTAFAYAPPSIEEEAPRVILAGPPLAQLYRQQLHAQARQQAQLLQRQQQQQQQQSRSGAASSSSAVSVDEAHGSSLEALRARAEQLARRVEQNVVPVPVPVAAVSQSLASPNASGSSSSSAASPLSSSGSSSSTSGSPPAATAAASAPLRSELFYADPNMLLEVRQRAAELPPAVVDGLQPHLPLFLPQPPDRLWIPGKARSASFDGSEHAAEEEQGGQALRRIQQNRRVESVLGRLRRRDDSFRPRNFNLATHGGAAADAFQTPAGDYAADSLWVGPDSHLPGSGAAVSSASGGPSGNASATSSGSASSMDVDGSQEDEGVEGFGAGPGAYFGQLQPSRAHPRHPQAPAGGIARFPPQQAPRQPLEATGSDAPQQEVDAFALSHINRQQQKGAGVGGDPNGTRMRDDGDADDGLGFGKTGSSRSSRRTRSAFVQAYM